MSENKEEVERHRQSYSSMTMHRGCPQRWAYKALRKLEKIEDEAPKRDLGSWWHMYRAAEAIDRGHRLGSLKWAPTHLDAAGVKVAVQETGNVENVLAALDKWWGDLTPFWQDEAVTQLGATIPERVEHMNQQWLDQWGKQVANEQPLAVEFFFSRPLPSYELASDVDPRTDLIGYIDEVYFDTQRNMVVIRDIKTTGSLATQTTVDDLMNSQLQVYAWGASQEIKTWGKGSPMAVAYDRIRSTAPKQPAITKSGTLSKSVTDYDARTYIKWVGTGVPYDGLKKDGSGAGVYELDPKVVANLSDPAAVSKWLQRTLTPLNKNIVRSHLLAAVDSAVDMNKSRERFEASGEVARLFSDKCKFCDFAQLCRSEMVGGVDGEYDLGALNLRVKLPKQTR